MENAARNPARRPTIRDVAVVAGVSRGTVSRVLNGGRWVSPGALVAVREAIRSTGYSANQHARSLVTGRANSVAFLLTEPQHLLFEDPTFSILLRGAAQALVARGMSLVVMVAGTEQERGRITEYVAAGHVDGVLLISSHQGSPVVGDLLGAGVPVISCGLSLGHERSVGSVSADDAGGAREMVRYLQGRGRRVIGTIAGPQDTPGGVDRLVGYRGQVGAGFEESLVVYGDYTRAGGQAAMGELLGRRPDLDAVFVASDLMAAGALVALREAGRSVPGEVAVGGFDDSGLAATLDPALTTMRQPFDRIAQEMVRLLLEVIDGADPARITLPTTLIERDST